MSKSIASKIKSAFSWTTDEAVLEQFECACGADVVGTAAEYQKVANNERIKCSECDAEYIVQMNVRLVPQQKEIEVDNDSDVSSSEAGSASVEEEFEGLEEDVMLKYSSSIAGSIKSWSVHEVHITDKKAMYEVTESQDGVEIDDSFAVHFSASSRDAGVVTKNGRKIGMFEEVTDG